jgi:class 3 adenylate cyclase
LTDLPSGTVTFLFTDIEGSTRLLRAVGSERYAQALADQERLLKTAFSGSGGQEIDTQGDAFFVAFPSAAEAVSAAEAAQRALAGHSWPEGSEVRVRMGMHTGEPVVGEARYIGLGVHRAARICSAGHGGQILLSETTRALVGNNLPDGTELRDLGDTELKDVQHERIFQLALPEQRSEFPPLKTAPTKTPADRLAEEIERKVHEQVLAGFDSGGMGTKPAVFGLLNLVLVVAAAAAIFLIVKWTLF